MKLSNTQWILVATVLAVAIWYFFFKEEESKYTKVSKDIRTCWAPLADGSGYYKFHDGPCTTTEARAGWSTHYN